MEWFKNLFNGRRHTSGEKDSRIKELERIIGVQIDNPALFFKALRHRSSLTHDHYEAFDSYERLEFLGDAVLDLIVSEILFQKFPKKDEGFLTKMRAKLVKGTQLSEYAQGLGIARLLEVGDEKNPSDISKNIQADAFESLVAAIYLTRGYKAAYSFVEKTVAEYVRFDSLMNQVDNYKSALLEYTQAHKKPLPVYKVTGESGPGHNLTFTVSVSVEGKVLGTGQGSSKKNAEQEAAKEALKSI